MDNFLGNFRLIIYGIMGCIAGAIGGALLARWIPENFLNSWGGYYLLGSAIVGAILGGLVANSFNKNDSALLAALPPEQKIQRQKETKKVKVVIIVIILAYLVPQLYGVVREIVLEKIGTARDSSYTN